MTKNYDDIQTGGIFGYPSPKSSLIHLIEAPWEVTTSYLSGTSKGPQAIYDASAQVDLFDIEVPDVIENGIYFHEAPDWILKENNRLKPLAQKIIKKRELGEALSSLEEGYLKEINSTAEKLQQWLFLECSTALKNGHVFGVIGGDHSTPLGAIQAYSEHYKGNIGVLHFDAHHDFRESYQGFKQSHASIMRNAMNLKTPPKKLVQVGIRDFSEEEKVFGEKHPNIEVFYDRAIKNAIYNGTSWNSICHKIVSELPENVYVSFDIDGLNPIYCPSTGTPVPGGQDFSEVRHLLMLLAKSGKKIVGFDLVEVAPGEAGEYDGNVAARLLYSLCAAVVASKDPSAVRTSIQLDL
jgi:agmatinase